MPSINTKNDIAVFKASPLLGIFLCGRENSLDEIKESIKVLRLCIFYVNISE